MTRRGLCDREPLVDGAGLPVRGDERGRRAASPGPDHPVLAREDEVRRGKRGRGDRGADEEVVGNAGEHRTGRAAVDADDERVDRDRTRGRVEVVERREIRAVVGYPPRAGRAARETPAVDQVRIGRGRCAGNV